jgi:apolipoprotein D and lipocalin family protein
MKNRVYTGLLISMAILVILFSCTSIPEKAEPVNRFDVNRYLGTWYEIARFDSRFEKNLDNVMAQYSLNGDGSIKVKNSGYNFKKSKWVCVEGIAKFRGNKETAALKVSFFGPFYSGYNVIALDENYRYALVAGKDLNYLWILSREKSIPENIRRDYIKKAQSIGYDTTKLIWVKHGKKSIFEHEK